VLEADPPSHTRTRTVLRRVLSPGNIRKLRDQFQREADVFVDRIIALGRFDGIKDLAEPYPVKVFADALGLAEEGRENLLPYGSMVFNSLGPRNVLTEAAFANADAVCGWIMENCARDKLAPHGLGAQIYAAVDGGELC
jgi:4-methoxybenzoate monooxygenase (O-demethylating)